MGNLLKIYLGAENCSQTVIGSEKLVLELRKLTVYAAAWKGESSNKPQ